MRILRIPSGLMRASNRTKMKRRRRSWKMFALLRRMTRIKLKSVIAEIKCQERQMMSWLSSLSEIPPTISLKMHQKPIL
jgi:hypothetical protein